ncbi:MAG TPA: carbamoyltransferase [Verrucomicrobiae bacterium]|nr:carbamoyltransferase [Verrucomicrobiae bacterium]
MRRILGISAFYHDSAAALIVDGEIVAAAQEERFSRKKNDENFPTQAARFCLRRAGISAGELDAVVFYDKPITKFTRMLETYLAIAPAGLRRFPRVLSSWLGEKLNVPRTIHEELPGLARDCPVLFTEHHHAHAASAFYPSPFEEAAILTIDGVGEWATTTIGRGRGSEIELLKEMRFPHSLGLLYSAFTTYCGFRVNSGEYKLMGLAPYGEPRFVDPIQKELIDLKEDGSFWLNLEYFDFLGGVSMTNAKFDALFGGPARRPEGPIEQRHMDVARSIQAVTERVMLRLARHAREATGLKNLSMAGGVALNCVANGLIQREKIFDEIWIQPAAGDAGGAIGAALAGWYASTPKLVRRVNRSDSMGGSFLGPEYSDKEIEETLRSQGAAFVRYDDPELLTRVIELLTQGKVVGWFQGRMEFGPRALGNRSILGDARSAQMQSVMNLKVKFRESFRPFAPVVREERARDYFDLEAESPYMLLVAPVKESLRRSAATGAAGLDRLKEIRSTIPAVTHIDYSARVQTVNRERNAKLYALLEKFEAASGSGVLVNTSFNVRGEPIVCSPEDAYRCFVKTEMDYLVVGNFVLERVAQAPEKTSRKGALAPD